MNIKHDRENVLKLGLGLFCARGYKSLGVDEICKHTGMTKGAFYNAFKSKEQFLVETISLYGVSNVQRIKKELLNNGNTAFERLRAFYLKMLKNQPNVHFAGCLVNNIMAELGAESTLVGIVTSLEFNKFIEAIEPTVEEAQNEGTLIRDMTANEIAQLLHSTFYGVLTRAKSSRDTHQSITIINLLFKNLKQDKYDHH